MAKLGVELSLCDKSLYLKLFNFFGNELVGVWLGYGLFIT